MYIELICTKTESCYDGNSVASGGTGSCHYHDPTVYAKLIQE